MKSFFVLAATGNAFLDTLNKILGIVVGFLVAFVVIFWISLIIWTFRDIRSRTQDFLSGAARCGNIVILAESPQGLRESSFVVQLGCDVQRVHCARPFLIG